MKRILISNLEENTEARISGWIDKIRDTKYMIFVILKDRTGMIQVSIDKANAPEMVEALNNVIANSVVEFTGKMVKSEYVKQGGKEFIPSGVKIFSLADMLPIDDTANIDTRMDYRWIDLRSERNHLIFKVQTAFVDGMRSFLIQNDFTEIHTPKLISTASESGSEVFEVKYFDRPAYRRANPDVRLFRLAKRKSGRSVGWASDGTAEQRCV